MQQDGTAPLPIYKVRLKKRCYRLVVCDPPAGVPSSSSAARGGSLFAFGQAVGALDDDEDDNLTYDPERDVYVLRMEVYNALHGFLIGKGGKTLKRLQDESGATIAVPKRNAHSDEVVLEGSRDAVLVARNAIDELVEDGVRSAGYTHFMSLPLSADHMMNRFAVLKEGMLSLRVPPDDTPIKDMDETVFIGDKRLHVTCFMLKLLSAAQVNRAKEVLQELSPQLYDAVGTTTVQLRVEGLDIMNDDWSTVDVMYAKVARDAQLKKVEKACYVILKAFMDEGLISEEEVDKQHLLDGDRIRIKWHMTVVNTKYRKDSGKKRSHSRGRGKRIPVDLTAVRERFESFEFGDVRVDSLHMSKLGGGEADKYYACEAKVNLP